MTKRPENQMLTVLRQHGYNARPTRSGEFEAIFLEDNQHVLEVHRILQNAGIIVELNFTYGIPMFINLSHRIK